MRPFCVHLKKKAPTMAESQPAGVMKGMKHHVSKQQYRPAMAKRPGEAVKSTLCLKAAFETGRAYIPFLVADRLRQPHSARVCSRVSLVRRYPRGVVLRGFGKPMRNFTERIITESFRLGMTETEAILIHQILFDQGFLNLFSRK